MVSQNTANGTIKPKTFMNRTNYESSLFRSEFTKTEIEDRERNTT